MTDVRQAIAGITPPELAEARIRDVWPTVARMPMIANLGKFLTMTIIFAPLAWLLMAGVYFGKLLPFIGIRYALTNRRVLIRRGWHGTARHFVLLSEIEDVRLETDTIDNFFRSADLTILRTGSTPLRLIAVPDPESFRHAILSARNAWVPNMVKTLPFISAAASK